MISIRRFFYEKGYKQSFVSKILRTAKGAVKGKIEELIYLGDHIRTRMTVAGHDDFIVKIPNTYGHEPLAEGTAATIGWNTPDCRALDPMDLS